MPNPGDTTPNPAIPPWAEFGANYVMPAPTPRGVVVLDPNDPFDAALIPIVEMNRRKRKDYAADGDPFSNFKTSSGLMGVAGFGPTEAAIFNVTQKLARLQSLRTNGRIHDTANESVGDTYLDLAVYAIIAYALYQSEMKRAETANTCGESNE